MEIASMTRPPALLGFLPEASGGSGSTNKFNCCLIYLFFPTQDASGVRLHETRIHLE